MNALDATALGQSGWTRPDPKSVIGFVVLFLLFTLAGYVIHAHIRAGHLTQWATGIVGLCFCIAIGFGFAVGLWVVDRIGIHEPYAVPPAWVVERDRSDRVTLQNGAEMEPTFVIERPSLEPTRLPER